MAMSTVTRRIGFGGGGGGSGKGWRLCLVVMSLLMTDLVVDAFVIVGQTKVPLSPSVVTSSSTYQRQQQEQQQGRQEAQKEYHDATRCCCLLRVAIPQRRQVGPCSVSTKLYGIPKMFRWLTDQYPTINRRLNEGLSTSAQVVDNFYLDMNGIIHPCTHGNSDSPEVVILDETAMFKRIFAYVDRLYKIIRPRRLLYLAVDGVAPRAKMNQQRSRRFRSAKDAEETASILLAREGKAVPENRFDSNCITPGTDFMLKLNLALQKWIAFKQANDPFWANGADVVLSGPDVPGEGEHKVMDYIRWTKSQYNPDNMEESHPHWRPKLRHVLYGLDADLIMLGLVTHEPHFMLLREKFSVIHRKTNKKDLLEYTRDDYDLLELRLLRQMLKLQFEKISSSSSPRQLNMERVIDDFVFLCMLVGNDFLPHAPHLEIERGALSLLLHHYMNLLPQWGKQGYLTDKDKICPSRLEELLYLVGLEEEEHFQRRCVEEGQAEWGLTAAEDFFYGTHYDQTPTPEAALPANEAPPRKRLSSWMDMAESGELTPTTTMTRTLQLDDGADYTNRILLAKTQGKKALPRVSANDISCYRDYYYAAKLHWNPSHPELFLKRRRAHVRDYLEGLHWVLHYYHKGCPSWNWFFPYLYAPLVTDMVNLPEFYNAKNDEAKDEEEQEEEGKKKRKKKKVYQTFDFELKTAFPSLAQLLSVLPPQSAKLLPKPLAELMLHSSSPLKPYYPSDFTVDANGKRQPWEAVVEIPFLDADLLLETVQSIVEQATQQATAAAAASSSADSENDTDLLLLLSFAELRRNARGDSHTFVPPARKGRLASNQQMYQVDNESSSPGQGRTVRSKGSSSSRNGGGGATSVRTKKTATSTTRTPKRRSSSVPKEGM